jgi:S-adenosylmethionine:tRNA ribosyltransferase-isomerase
MPRPASRGDEPAAPPAGAPASAVASGFDYELAPERIAQEPARERDAARLLVVPRGRTEGFVDARIGELTRWLRAGDLLVVNRSRVVPARLHARRLPGGGALELLLLAPSRESGGAETRERTSRAERWTALARPAKRLRPGQRVAVARAAHDESPGGGVEATVLEIGEGSVELEFPPGVDVLTLLSTCGETPLPPYIRRPDGPTPEDAERYQTVFAREPGSVAAPTAGLHLTERLLEEIRALGARAAEVVLHVGPATFLAGQPGRSALAVEPERYLVPRTTRELVAETRGRGRVIAVGTTTTRALESASRAGWPEGWQSTSLVLSPGSAFEVVDGLLTNFHLPGSSLLALVSAFAGVECARAAYGAALERGYRFYSYGDAMLIVDSVC